MRVSRLISSSRDALLHRLSHQKHRNLGDVFQQFISSSYSSYNENNNNNNNDFARGFHRVFGFGLALFTIAAFDSAADDVLLFNKAKSVAVPKLESSQRVMQVLGKGKPPEADVWYNASCNRRGRDVRVLAFIADGEKASCDVKVVISRKFERGKRRRGRRRKQEAEEEEEVVEEEEASLSKSAWLRSPLKYMPESVKNSLAVDDIWEIAEVSVTLPNEQGMGIPGQVDLLHSSSSKNA